MVGGMTTVAALQADPTLQKIVNVLGAERAGVLTREILQEIGLQSLETPNDRLAFGDALVRRGGVLAAIGGAIRVQAFLRGAKAK
jgi:hypothetical protein